MSKVIGFVVILLGVAATVALLAALLTFPAMWAINWLFTPAVLLAVFGIAKFTFWKTFVLVWLAGTLFKSSAASSSK